MGCWYETCGLSGLPITPDDKALVVLLVPGSSIDDGRGGFCYPVGLWSPLCPPFFGTYNDDRGTLNFAKKAPAHWALTKERIAEFKPVWQDDRYDKEWKKLPVTYDYEKFFEPIERGWVHGVGYLGRRNDDHTFPIGQVIIREDVWDHLLSTKREMWYGNTAREQGHADAREFVKYVVENPPPEALEEGLSWAFSVEHHFEGKPSTFYHSLFSPGESGPCFSHYRIKLMHDLVFGKVEPETALAVFYEIADVAHINRLMSHLRRAWRPQSGKGSQDIEWDLHEGFARRVAEIAEACRKYDEEGQ